MRRGVTWCEAARRGGISGGAGAWLTVAGVAAGRGAPVCAGVLRSAGRGTPAGCPRWSGRAGRRWTPAGRRLEATRPAILAHRCVGHITPSPLVATDPTEGAGVSVATHLWSPLPCRPVSNRLATRTGWSTSDCPGDRRRG
ncbi:hypothetical protein FRACA_430024 [Frankia canadensis]|uniref:Uncharacterized protein n=1 Tax=Frankia canadensis TaxID=1836972 RepID=A0A2I2KX89_9ACTN|nr:hypothetical protein FRACA_430024 [Frankia canadensis]SOU57571.1 hypothetical protein FRACA_430024 [Frankia canadensis]